MCQFSLCGKCECINIIFPFLFFNTVLNCDIDPLKKTKKNALIYFCQSESSG